MKTVSVSEISELKKVNLFCRLLGHHWRYKDYSNWINEKGDSYDFKASRSCTRCSSHEYFHDKWEASNEKSPRDMQSDDQSTNRLFPMRKPLNKINI
jgi:hypothetical protein